jgi:hypothetical protein
MPPDPSRRNGEEPLLVREGRCRLLNRRPEVAKPPPNEGTAFLCIDRPIGDCAVGADTSEIADLALLGRPKAGLLRMRSYARGGVEELERLGMQWSSLFADVEWLPKVGGALVGAGSIFTINRGERRGWDEMFYPEGAHGIEPEYLVPVLKSPKSVTGMVAQPDSLAFCCDKPLAELERLGHKGALRWIARFTHGRNETGIPLPESLARSGMEWYQMDPATRADLAMSINYDERLYVARLEQRPFVNQRLTRLTANNPNTDTHLCHALMNCILGVFYIESLGFGRGLGVLDLNSTKMKQSLFMLDPVGLSAEARAEIMAAFSPLLKRSVEPVTEELARADRQEFDRVVLRSYGLGGYYESIRDALLTLYRIRKAAEA